MYLNFYVLLLTGLVVVDEIHMIGEGKRGATLETLLCKLLLAPVSPRVVAMSATIGNIDELSYFLKVSIFPSDNLDDLIQTNFGPFNADNSGRECNCLVRNRRTFSLKTFVPSNSESTSRREILYWKSVEVSIGARRT